MPKLDFNKPLAGTAQIREDARLVNFNGYEYILYADGSSSKFELITSGPPFANAPELQPFHRDNAPIGRTVRKKSNGSRSLVIGADSVRVTLGNSTSRHYRDLLDNFVFDEDGAPCGYVPNPSEVTDAVLSDEPDED